MRCSLKRTLLSITDIPRQCRDRDRGDDSDDYDYYDELNECEACLTAYFQRIWIRFPFMIILATSDLSLSARCS